jgi:hypothetical protein
VGFERSGRTRCGVDSVRYEVFCGKSSWATRPAVNLVRYEFRLDADRESNFRTSNSCRTLIATPLNSIAMAVERQRPMLPRGKGRAIGTLHRIARIRRYQMRAHSASSTEKNCLWAVITTNFTRIESAICGRRRGRVFGQCHRSPKWASRANLRDRRFRTVSELPTILELSDWPDPLGALAIWLDCFNLDQKAIRYVR